MDLQGDMPKASVNSKQYVLFVYFYVYVCLPAWIMLPIYIHEPLEARKGH